VRYWWVNQNQTYRHEIAGGYLWSPKRKSNGQRNAFYEFMREVSPGDVVFSFSETLIAAIGIARSYCYESPKPTEFGTTGSNWGQIGWKVDVSFRELSNRIRPKNHMDRLASHLSDKYAPLRQTGDGLQSVYLTEVAPSFATALFAIIGNEANMVRDAANAVAAEVQSTPANEPTLEEWERREETRVLEAKEVPETDRLAIVLARRGQGIFRANVREVERACRVTRVDRPEHLIASHIRPWRDSSNGDRLAGENGLLLTPTIDHLFDKGFISFEGDGRLIVSPVAHEESLLRMGIRRSEKVNVGAFSEQQRQFLDYHRENVFREAGVRR
jgi:putative restriction endonuclease